MSGGDGTKEWVRATKPAAGKSTITVTLQQGNVTVKWAAYTFGNMKKGLAEARKGAQESLSEMVELLGDG